MSKQDTITVKAPAGKRLILGTEYIVADTAELAELIHQSILRRITTPGLDQYGGATITLASDGAGTRYVAFCARKLSNDVFGFYIIDITHGREVQYSPFCTGRGSISNTGIWIAWKDKDYYWGQIPGYVGYPDYAGQIAALLQRVAMLEQQASGLAQSVSALDAQNAALAARVAELEQRPTGGGGLTAEQQVSLDWLVGWLQPLLAA